MSVRTRAPIEAASLPLVALLSCATLPLFFLGFRFSALLRIDVSSLAPTLAFAIAGAMVSAILGGALGAAAGTLDASGRRWAVGASAALIAAPPAFWWIGLTRLPVGLGSLNGPVSGSVVAGCALAPVTFFLVLAATREISSSTYEAARVALPPARRVAFVLFPQLRAAVISGFLFTVILLLGESEIPFLFGFRTSMTDVVTTFSQTYDVGRTLPIILPLIATVLLLGVLMAGPLFSVILPGARGDRGVVRKPAGWAVGVGLLILPLLMTLSLAGFAWMAISGVGGIGRRLPPGASTLMASVAEPIVCALSSLGLAVLAAYPARRSAAIRPLTVVGLLLFCVPAAVVAIGWIGVAQTLDGIPIAPALAHVSRTIGLPALGFLVAYARLPPSLEDAARLVPLPPIRRAWTLMLPLMVPSLAATAALTGALIFADRDIASLLLAPGESRLMLNFYLLSANAPSAVIGVNALLVFAAGAAVVMLAGVGPFVLMAKWRG